MSNSVKYVAYKDSKDSKMWWVDKTKDGVVVIGENLFTFDKKKVYNLFADYPDKLSVKDWIIFCDENEYWVEFFKDRNEEYIMKHTDEIEELGRNDLIKKIVAMQDWMTE